MKFRIPPVYPITDSAISDVPVVEQVRQFVEGGARLIQIREKTTSSREFYESVVAAMAYTRGRGVRIIVNDRVDIALLAGADGVHLGQQDLHPRHARRILGADAIIGYSTHNLDQAAEAAEFPIDYLAFGPIYETSTKADHDPIVGLEELPGIRAIAGDLPLVAIGGIDRARLCDVLRSGADSAAVIRAVLSGSSGISKEIAAMIETAHRCINSVDSR